MASCAAKAEAVDDVLGLTHPEGSAVLAVHASSLERSLVAASGRAAAEERLRGAGSGRDWVR